ncbi:MAG: hypothetical protein O3B84_06190, partial [Chloroflexi bacterium]|nr:hypothetical protein [Chloroflexota bacterium]
EDALESKQTTREPAHQQTRRRFLFYAFEPPAVQSTNSFVGTRVRDPEGCQNITSRRAQRAISNTSNPTMTIANLSGLPNVNRVLIEAGGSANLHFQTTTRIPGVTREHIAIWDDELNLRYGARATSLAVGGSYSYNPRRIYQGQASVSYVPGSHNFKTGFNIRRFNEGDLDRNDDQDQHNQGLRYMMQRVGVPQAVVLFATPHGFEESIRDVGIYAQDQWTIQQLTLNLGLRYNDVEGWTNEQRLVAGRFVPERVLAGRRNVPHWRNLDPRIGAAYDLFGNGRTAVKGALGRYATRLISVAENPARNMAPSTTISWNDANGNLVPDCDLLNPAANGECGKYSDLNFGKVRAGTTNAEDALEGFNQQDYNWQGSVSMQHELMPNVGINVGYFRTWYGNFVATDALNVTPADYDEFCVQTPVDNRLPTSGQRICGLYDLKPAAFGTTGTNRVVTQADHFGNQTQVFNGVDVLVNARGAEGIQFNGGVSIGRTTTDSCFTVDSPQDAREGFCNITPPWSSGTQFRGSLVYPMPYGLQASVIYQNLPGIEQTASLRVPSSAVERLAPGPSLSGGVRSVNVDLIPSRSQFEDRLQQVDLRFTKNVNLQQFRVRGNFDIYNIFNQSNVLRLNDRYGGTWLNASNVMGGRLIRVSARLDF